MVINVSFIDKNVKFFFDNKLKKNIFSKISDKIKKDKSTDQTTPLEEKEIKPKEEFSINVISKSNNENATVEKNNKTVSIESDSQNENTNEEVSEISTFDSHIKSSKDTLDNCFNFKSEFNEQKIINYLFDKNCNNLELFLDSVFSLEDYFSNDFIQQSKRVKKSLILPDELIGFDTLTVPSLSLFKINGAVKLKISVDFNDSQNLNFKFKPILKSKPNSVYLIQFLRRKFLNKILIKFKTIGINFTSINFYSSVLADYYLSKLKISKLNTIIVRVEDNHTTIIALSRGLIVSTISLACGTDGLLNNTQYKFDEHSKKMTAYKFICHEINNINNENQTTDENLSIETIEKDFPKSRTNLLAPIFQMRNVYAADLVCQKINELTYFLKNSEFKMNIDKIIIDTDNPEVYEILKTDNSELVSFDEVEILSKVKQNPITKFEKIKDNTKLNWSSLWKKVKSKA